ncbi:hypothetical protein [Amycolatopsis sp. NPDC051371]|uniref:hypothetical protein n=1 Tax=Amycolatopsis sp. NPDC051371 TaxID=3155800 RepID=UPI00342FA768
MSPTNGKNHIAATDAINGDRHLQAVIQQTAVTTEDKMRAALADNPGSTTAALAMAAGVGRSTAAKILARWGRDGTALRTAGAGPRIPDTWTLAQSDSTTVAPDADDTPTDATATASGNHASDTDTTNAKEDGTETKADTGDGPSTEVTTAKALPSDTDADGKQTSDGKNTGNGTVASDTTSPPSDSVPVSLVTEQSETGSTRSAETAPPGAATADTAPAEKDRLPKGGLRALVEEYLTEHASDSFGPAKIGRNLGRSGGAVNNALEKMVADGYAIKTCEAPKRFAINPDKVDVPPITGAAG